MLQDAAGSAALTELVRGALNEMIHGEVERRHHVHQFIIGAASRISRIDGHQLKGPEPALLLDNVLSKIKEGSATNGIQSGLKEYADSVAVMKGNHRHSFTCRKPPDGHIGCRLCRPLATREFTCPVYLSRDEETGSVGAVENIAPRDVTISECELRPGSSDARIIVWELQRKQLHNTIPSQTLNDLSDSLVGAGDVELGQKAKSVVISVLTESLGIGCDKELVEWLEKRERSEILDLCQTIIDKLPKANGNIVDFNPVSVMGTFID